MDMAIWVFWYPLHYFLSLSLSLSLSLPLSLSISIALYISITSNKWNSSHNERESKTSYENVLWLSLVYSLLMNAIIAKNIKTASWPTMNSQEIVPTKPSEFILPTWFATRWIFNRFLSTSSWDIINYISSNLTIPFHPLPTFQSFILYLI